MRSADFWHGLARRVIRDNQWSGESPVSETGDRRLYFAGSGRLRVHGWGGEESARRGAEHGDDGGEAADNAASEGAFDAGERAEGQGADRRGDAGSELTPGVV